MELKDVKLGDELMCILRMAGGVTFARVTKVTATQATLDNGERVLLGSGIQVGTSSSYHTKYWCRATAEAHAKHDIRNKINKAKKGLQGITVTEHNVEAILGFLSHFAEELKGDPKAQQQL